MTKTGAKKITGDAAVYADLRKTIQKRISMDGYADFCKKIGNALDTIKFTPAIGNDTYFAQLYVGNGLFKKIVDLIPNDMTRQWIDIPADEDGKILKMFKKIKLRQALNKALKFERLYGGALIYMVINDGGTAKDPVNLKKITSILKLKVYPRPRVGISAQNYYEDPLQEKFDEPEFFDVSPFGGKTFTVHESRCLTFTGELVPEEVDGLIQRGERFWGMSAMQPIFERLANYGISEEAILKLIIKSNFDVLKINGLMKLLSTTQGKKDLKERVNLLDASKSVGTTLVLDQLEEVTNNVANFTGVSDAVGKVQEGVSAIADIPIVRLFGTSAKGMNATGDNEVRQYYDMIKFLQEEKLDCSLDRMKLYSCAILKLDADDYDHDYFSLWQQTEKEKAETRKIIAETDQINIASQVITPREVRNSRFTGKFSIETQLEEDDPYGTDGHFNELEKAANMITATKSAEALAAAEAEKINPSIQENNNAKKLDKKAKKPRASKKDKQLKFDV